MMFPLYFNLWNLEWLKLFLGLHNFCNSILPFFHVISKNHCLIVHVKIDELSTTYKHKDLNKTQTDVNHPMSD